MWVAGHVIQRQGHRRVLELPLVVDRFDRHTLWILRERVGLTRVGTRGHGFHPGAVAAVRDHREALRDRRAESGRVVEVVVRDDELRERLAGNGLPGFRDHRQSPRFALGRIDQHQVVAELDERAVVRLAGEEPETLSRGLHRHVGAGGAAAGAVAAAGAARSPTSPSIACDVACSVHIVKASTRPDMRAGSCKPLTS